MCQRPHQHSRQYFRQHPRYLNHRRISMAVSAHWSVCRSRVQERLEGDAKIEVRDPYEHHVKCIINVEPGKTTCGQIVRAACSYFRRSPTEYVLAYTKTIKAEGQTVSDAGVFDAVMLRKAAVVWLAARPCP